MLLGESQKLAQGYKSFVQIPIEVATIAAVAQVVPKAVLAPSTVAPKVVANQDSGNSKAKKHLGSKHLEYQFLNHQGDTYLD